VASSDLSTHTGHGVVTSVRFGFRSKCRPVLLTQNATSEGTETSRFSRVFLWQKVMKLLNSTIQKNPQKHWVFANCARLRWVISLSSICVRAWELTKVTGAIWRTGFSSHQLTLQRSRFVRCPNASFRTLEFSPRDLSCTLPASLSSCDCVSSCS
jgi:hypothetical protein